MTRKFMAGRKATFFSIFLVIFFIILLTRAYLGLSAKFSNQKIGLDRSIGARQADIIASAQEGENALFFVDQSAKYALHDALRELAGKGGFTDESACGTYMDKQLLNGETENCTPYILYNLEKSFLSSLESRTAPVYPAVSKDNYKVAFVSKDGHLSVIGSAGQSISLDILSKESSIRFGSPIIGHYLVKPSFNVRIEHNISYYDLIYESAHGMIDTCSKKRNPFFCVSEYAANQTAQTGLEWRLGCMPESDPGLATFMAHATMCVQSPDVNCFCQDDLYVSGSFRLKQTAEGIEVSSVATGANASLGAGTLAEAEMQFDGGTNLDLRLDPAGNIYVAEAKPLDVRCTTSPLRNFTFCVNASVKLLDLDVPLPGLEDTIVQFALHIPDKVALSAVSGLSASDSPVPGTITLSWTSVTDAEFDHYDVFCSALPFDDVSQRSAIASTTSTQADMTRCFELGAVSPISDATRYYFAVVAVDKSGNFDAHVQTVEGRSVANAP